MRSPAPTPASAARTIVIRSAANATGAAHRTAPSAHAIRSTEPEAKPATCASGAQHQMTAPQRRSF